MELKTVTCLSCGTVSMGVSRAFAENEVKEFNRYYDSLSKKERSHWSGHSKIETYRCCKKMSLRPFKEGDCPVGVTLSSVILEGVDK